MGSRTDLGDDRDSGSADGRSRPALSLVIPSRGAAGKSRLTPPAGVLRSDLARAMALDTVAAAVACPDVGSVVVVTADAELVAALPAGVLTVPDPGTGLAAAVSAGLRVASRRIGLALNPRVDIGDGAVDRVLRPDSPGPSPVLGVLLGDVPALTPSDLSVAVQAALRRTHPCDGVEPDPAFVPDLAGTGTVLLIGRADRLRPAFGAGSAARHERRARRLDLALPRLRCDVDDAVDLAVSMTLGLGPATRAVLARGVAAGEP